MAEEKGKDSGRKEQKQRWWRNEGKDGGRTKAKMDEKK